ncbi:hypothetical protein [Succinimonas sp.]|uniref:hypothetical protein n=1 Tax=Succinimonas sp. TaxID=1936151 RepID=UPI00386C93BF
MLIISAQFQAGRGVLLAAGFPELFGSLRNRSRGRFLLRRLLCGICLVRSPAEDLFPELSGVLTELPLPCKTAGSVQKRQSRVNFLFAFCGLRQEPGIAETAFRGSRF